MIKGLQCRLNSVVTFSFVPSQHFQTDEGHRPLFIHADALTYCISLKVKTLWIKWGRAGCMCTLSVHVKKHSVQFYITYLKKWFSFMLKTKIIGSYPEPYSSISDCYNMEKQYCKHDSKRQEEIMPLLGTILNCRLIHILWPSIYCTATHFDYAEIVLWCNSCKLIPPNVCMLTCKFIHSFTNSNTLVILIK